MSQLLIFREFIFEKARGNGALFRNTDWGEQVRIRQFVTVILEVVQLDQPLSKQRLDAEIGFAKAHVQGSGQFSLR